LGKGFVTGAINENTAFDSTDFRNKVPRFSPENRRANQVVVDVIAGFAARLKATPTQIALAWLLARKPWIIPIPGRAMRLDLYLPAESNKPLPLIIWIHGGAWAVLCRMYPKADMPVVN
jgi:acetyl esterase/lipase